MNNNMKKLLEMMSTNEELANKLKEADKDTVIATAKELGIELTDADFDNSSELTDDELDSVAGGGSCTCVFGGGGSAEHRLTKTCVCVSAGGGAREDGSARCVCVAFGEGYAY